MGSDLMSRRFGMADNILNVGMYLLAEVELKNAVRNAFTFTPSRNWNLILIIPDLVCSGGQDWFTVSAKVGSQAAMVYDRSSVEGLRTAGNSVILVEESKRGHWLLQPFQGGASISLDSTIPITDITIGVGGWDTSKGYLSGTVRIFGTLI